MDCSVTGFCVLYHLPKFAQFMPIEIVMLSNHLIFCPLLLPSVFPIRWPNYWNLSFSTSPSSSQPWLFIGRTDEVKVYQFYLSKGPVFSFIDIFCCFLNLCFIYLYSDLYDFFPSTNFGFHSSFSSCFRCKVRLFEIFIFSWGKIVLL